MGVSLDSATPDATEWCPECGLTRQDGARYCASCQYDFESLAHKYRGTEWSQAAAPVARRRAAPTGPVVGPARTPARKGMLILAFYVGIAAVGATTLLAIHAGLLPDVAIPVDAARVMTWLIACVAGVASQAIPGHHMRDYRRSIMVGGLGYAMVAVVVFGAWNAGESGWLWVTHLRGVIEHGLAAFAGATIIRLALLGASVAILKKLGPAPDPR
jgi:hypothetical protein